MPRPIESLLSLPRVRLFDRIPILETERLVEKFINHDEFPQRLVKSTIEVSEGSAEQFAADGTGLSTLLEEVEVAEYVVNNHSRKIMEGMLSDIYQDGDIFKMFRRTITPLCQLSRRLHEVSSLADGLADRAKEEAIDLARALLIDPPKHKSL